jgi:spermidine synthase
MYAIATVGSLLGTFLASLVLIPFIGTQRTFLVFSAVVAGAACVGLARRWLLAPIALALLLALPPGATKLDDAATVLYETETAYQYVRIVEEPDGVRRLELNERQATHSLYRPGTVLTGGVWDGYLALPFAIRDAAPDRIAILGFGAGTTARAYARYFPATRIDGVELDGELLRLGKRFFGLQDRRQLRLYA